MTKTSVVIFEGQAWRVLNALHELLKNGTLHAEDQRPGPDLGDDEAPGGTPWLASPSYW